MYVHTLACTYIRTYICMHIYTVFVCCKYIRTYVHVLYICLIVCTSIVSTHVHTYTRYVFVPLAECHYLLPCERMQIWRRHFFVLTSRKLFFTTEVEDEENEQGEDEDNAVENV